MPKVLQICGQSLWSANNSIWWPSRWSKYKGHSPQKTYWSICWHNCTCVRFHMVFNGKKEDFLSNKMNKHRFIMLLRDHLESQGCCTDQARADADLLIVQTAIAAAESTPRAYISGGWLHRLAGVAVFPHRCINDQLVPPSRAKAWSKAPTKMLEHCHAKSSSRSWGVQQHFVHAWIHRMWHYISNPWPWERNIIETDVSQCTLQTAIPGLQQPWEYQSRYHSSWWSSFGQFNYTKVHQGHHLTFSDCSTFSWRLLSANHLWTHNCSHQHLLLLSSTVYGLTFKCSSGWALTRHQKNEVGKWTQDSAFPFWQINRWPQQSFFRWWDATARWTVPPDVAPAENITWNVHLHVECAMVFVVIQQSR